MNLRSEVSSEGLDQCPDRVDLLFAALQLNQDLESLSKLRLALLTDPQALPSLIVTADRRRLLSALLFCLEEKQLLEMSACRADPLLCQLAVARTRFNNRRIALLRGLAEIIHALNERDIVPLLLKGSVSLWRSSPSWRFQRDIDILVEPGMADAAQEVILALGFEPMAGQVGRPHHMQAVVRDDLPASIEVHFAASNPRGERYFPTSEFWLNCEQSKSESGTVFLPGPIAHMLHIVVHSQISNRNATYGVLPMKRLYEFAWEVENSTAETVMQMYERARNVPRLLAAVDFWMAAISSEFGVGLPGGLTVPADARRRWQDQRMRMVQDVFPGLLTAFREETGMIRARSRTISELLDTYLVPLGDILIAPRLRNMTRHARQSTGFIPD